jgi:starch phosphorylase
MDGWWDEAYDGEVGWAIGQGEEYDNAVAQDEAESRAICELLEDEISPSFYQQNEDGLPRRWIARMKTSMQRLSPVYNTNRMVQEYTESYYLPALQHELKLTATDFRAARALARWQKKVLPAWHQVAVLSVEEGAGKERSVGEDQTIRGLVRLGDLSPEDVQVEIYYGRIDSFGGLQQAQRRGMRIEGEREKGVYSYEGLIPCDRAGKYGYTVRVLPRHPNLVNPWELGRVAWWQNQ